jgi:hypothetical protein
MYLHWEILGYSKWNNLNYLKQKRFHFKNIQLYPGHMIFHLKIQKDSNQDF